MIDVKKIIGIFLCFMLVLLFASCGESEKKVSDTSGALSEDEKQISVFDNKANGESSKDTTTSNKGSSSDTSSKSDAKNKNKNKNNSSNKSSLNDFSDNEKVELPEINSSVEEKVEEEIPVVSGGDTTEKDELVLGEDYGAFLYEGDFVNLAIDNDKVYCVFKSPNVIVAYDADELDPIYSAPLEGRPAEIQVDGNDLLISFPDLKCIKVYNKNTFALVRSISLPNVVSSFCIDGNVVYYSEDNQHCKVFCTNLLKNETKTILNHDDVPERFYFPKLLLNKAENLLYIGESGSSGSEIYYYNTSDLSLHSKYAKDNYGHFNNKRTMYLVGNNVFWGGFRLAADDAEEVIGEYTGNATYYADENFVITAKGIYDTDTYQKLGEIDTAIYMAVTKNKSLVAVFSYSPTKVVVIVPY